MPECEWPTWVQWFWILESSATFASMLATIPIVLMGV